MQEEKTAVEIIDEMPFAALFRELVAFSNHQRAIELLGWATVLGPLVALGVYKDPAALRYELENRGLSRSAVYRALADIKRFGEQLEQKHSAHPRPWPHGHIPTYELLAKVASVPRS